MGNPRIGSLTTASTIILPSEPTHIATKDQSDSVCERDYFEHSPTTLLMQKFMKAESETAFTHIYKDLFSPFFPLDLNNLAAKKSALSTLKTFINETSKEQFTKSMAKLLAVGIALNYRGTLDDHRKDIKGFIDTNFTDGLEDAGKEVKTWLTGDKREKTSDAVQAYRMLFS